MADTKITALAAITTVDPAADVLPIVDISDTSMAASGTTKKITSNQILGAGGTATLASATITGAATVGTTLGVTGVSTFAAGTALLPALTTTGDTNTGIYYPAADTFAVTTGGTERYRVDSSGNVGISVTPSAWGSSLKAFEIGAKGNALFTTSSVVDGLFMVNNAYYDTAYKYAANGYASRYTHYQGAHQWFTAASGTAGNAITFTQAMTLTASGDLLLACTSAPTGTTPGFYFDSTRYAYFSRSAGETLNLNRYTSTGATAKFRYAGTEVGDISVTGSGTTFNSISDYRLKESVAPLSGGLARVNALKPSIYKWKSDGSNGEGFIAHELADVVPLAVTGEKDAVNEDGSIKPQGVDLSRVVPILVAAIQELTAEVNALKNA